MGWRFRHSFKIIPGVKLNLSKSGLSCSVGGAPFTVNVGQRGVYGTASLPGTGISFRQRLASGSGTSHEPNSSLPPHFVTPESFPTPTPSPVTPAPTSTGPVQEVRSASSELLTSETLKELKRVIQTAHEEHEDISGQLDTARSEKATASQRYYSWENGFLFKRLFKKKFEQRKVNLETATAKVGELEEQLRLTTVATQVEIAKEQAEPYFKMRDEFAALSECGAIWDVKSYQTTNKFRERTTAEKRIDRERVTFSLGTCDLIQWEQKVPHLQNVNGGDLFLYPGFILYRAAREAFSVIAFHDVKGNAVAVKFQEEQGVPKDSKVIGQTWAKCNKDGSRDKRFVNNYQIPIVLYASLALKSETGLWEEFQFSNPELLQRFLAAFNAFVVSFGAS
jgi:Protein of unknown function (DUF4236)